PSPPPAAITTASASSTAATRVRRRSAGPSRTAWCTPDAAGTSSPGTSTAATVGVVEAVDADTCLLSTGSNSLDELALYIGLFGFRFRVLGPPELVER